MPNKTEKGHLRQDALPNRAFFEKCASWPDLFGRCHYLIDKSFPDHATIIDIYSAPSMEKENTNPNLEKLRALEQFTYEVSGAHWHDAADRPAPDVQTYLCQVLDEAYEVAKSLEPFGTCELNVLTPWYFILLGIDRAAAEQPGLSNEKTLEEMNALNDRRRKSGKRNYLERQEVFGPINEDRDGESANIGVYFKPRFNFIERISTAHKLERLEERTLNGRYQALMCYITPDKCAALPSMLLLPRPSGWVPPDESHPLRIGIVPFSRDPFFDFQDSNEAGIHASIVPAAGASFVIRYPDSYCDMFADHAINAVDSAIKKGCHIVVFPELVMPVSVVERVAEHIKLLNGKHSLALVVAGSGWSSKLGDDGQAIEANICHLIDAYGDSAGECHKAKRFHLPLKHRKDDIAPSGAEGMSKNPDKPTEALLEGFTHPGKAMSIVIIPDFGSVLSVICKDLASSEPYVASLAAAFNPQLICCPAYSKSLDRGFSLPARQMAERFLSAVCVCDLCGSRGSIPDGRDNWPIGVVTTPGFYPVVPDDSEAASDGLPTLPEPAKALPSAKGYSTEKEAGDAKSRPRSEKMPQFVCSEALRTRECEAVCNKRNTCLIIAEIDYGNVSDTGIKPLVNISSPFTC